MIERLLSMIRPKGKELHSSVDQRQRRTEIEEMSPHGYIQIGEERIGIIKPFIYAGSIQEPVLGEISSNVTGTITAIHEPIELTIKPSKPSSEESPVENEAISLPQKIGNIASHDDEHRQNLINSIFGDSKELDNITGQVNTLIEQLERLKIEDTYNASRLVRELQEKRTSLQKSKEHKESKLREFDKKSAPSADSLRVRAKHKDVTMRVEDPNVGVVIEGSSRREHDIKGISPNNPEITIGLYLTHGIAHINYSPRPKTE